MAFRDDREILKQKARSLERDLVAAESKLDAQRSETERVQKLEAELAEARGMLTRIEAQLPKPAASSGRRLAIGLVALLGMGVGGMLVLTRSRTMPRPQMTEPVVLHPPALPAIAPVATVPPVVTPPLPDGRVVEVKAHWAGKAKTVTGMPIKVGSPCNVDAVLRSTQKHDVTVSCGDQVLYRSTDVLEGMAQMSVGVEESPAVKRGHAHAALVWHDIGARSGARAQASVNSQARASAAWRDTLPSYRVEIEIPELSAPYEGAFGRGHSHESLPFQERIERRAKVVTTGGKASVKVGTHCNVSLYPQWGGGFNCRAIVSCADRVLYGAGLNGFSTCEVVDGKPSAFHDNVHEGDPVLNWDIALGSMALVVKEGDAEWNAELSVSP